MTLIPAFEIGVWNAWILMLPLLLPPPILTSIKKGIFRKTESNALLSKTEKRIFIFSKLVMLSAFVYSVFLPLELGTLWFYVGLPIYLLGLVMYAVVTINIVSSPVDQPITRGLYRYSRHPMYVASFPVLVGAAAASASWLFLLLSILFTVSHFINGIAEERLCLEAYGGSYREYVSRTPRWIGIPKSGKSS